MRAERLITKNALPAHKSVGIRAIYIFALRCIFAAATLLPAAAFAQADIHFSQFYETSILRNPSLTGVFTDDYKVGAYYRNQWSSITHPYVTALITGETRVSVSSTSDDYLSFGLLAYSDKAGSIDQKITSFYPAVNFSKSLRAENNSYLSVGFTGGYMQLSFDPEKATFNNQYQNGHFNASNPSLETLPAAKLSLWDMGAGINYNASAGENNRLTYIVGISGYHFTQPKYSYYQTNGITQNMRWNGNFAISSFINQSFTIQAQGNYAMQGTYKEIVAGGLVNWTQIVGGLEPIFGLSGGLFYRVNDAIIPVLKVRYKKMSVGVSYDVNISTLKDASKLQGGFELTMFLTGNFTDKSGFTKKTVCPRF